MKKATRFAVQPGWKLLFADMGLNPSEVLRQAGLPQDLFSRPSASLSVEDYFSLWDGLERVAGDQELPLMVGQAISVEAFDPPIFASLCSPNLNIALKRLSEFKRLIGPMTLNVDINDARTLVTMSC